ncbi:hypothetical protein AVEN_257385-1 [Araneus ventricosus]|uniref:Uncharacterized protein n=1 Tax=Araneus ventricosus TaxID=182803 RepID=A0A4Y2C8W5_ARAVE|nr:hypothetical protein AVEN_257385-1 [Araneus ventricosus]
MFFISTFKVQVFNSYIPEIAVSVAPGYRIPEWKKDQRFSHPPIEGGPPTKRLAGKNAQGSANCFVRAVHTRMHPGMESLKSRTSANTRCHLPPESHLLQRPPQQGRTTRNLSSGVGIPQEKGSSKKPPSPFGSLNQHCHEPATIEHRFSEYRSTETSVNRKYSSRQNPDSELAGLIEESSGFEECGQGNIQDWLEYDMDDPGYQILANDENIVGVIDYQDPCDDDEEPSENDRAEKGPSTEEAFHCLETVIKWLEQQEECVVVISYSSCSSPQLDQVQEFARSQKIQNYW